VPSKICWRSAGFSFLQIKEWNEEFAVFQPDSGKTHFLNQMSMQILSALDQSPASAEDICRFLAEQFQLRHDQNFSQQIIKALHRLDELGLIEKAGWEPSA
jgi:PqqD family protein of HPr-rel-A system